MACSAAARVGLAPLIGFYCDATKRDNRVMVAFSNIKRRNRDLYRERRLGSLGLANV
jgi:hypothetical protein